MSLMRIGVMVGHTESGWYAQLILDEGDKITPLELHGPYATDEIASQAGELAVVALMSRAGPGLEKLATVTTLTGYRATPDEMLHILSQLAPKSMHRFN